MSILSSFWEDFLKSISENEKDSPVLLNFLRQVAPLELTEEKILLGCPNTGLKFFLEKKLPDVEKALHRHLKKKVGVYLQVTEPKKKKVVPPLLSFEPSQEDIFRKSGLSLKYSFENFAVSTTNQVAHAAALAVAHDLGKKYNPLFLYGGVGVGKTHLAQAVAKAALEQDKQKKILFCPGDNFINELVESIRDKTTQKFRRHYRFLNLLILDDIQFIAGKERVQEEFFHTFNSVISSGGQIILTSDRKPEEIKNLEDRLRSRFSGGLTVDIQSPEPELRTAILLLKSKEKTIDIDMEAAKLIAEKITDSRALEGTLLSLYARILGRSEKIDLKTAESFFSEKEDIQSQKLTRQDIIRAVCTFYNVRPSQLKGAVRIDSIAFPRQVTMYLLRRELKLTQEETAYVLKRKDHTTVIHAVNKIEKLSMRNPVFRSELEKIIQTLHQST